MMHEAVGITAYVEASHENAASSLLPHATAACKRLQPALPQ